MLSGIRYKQVQFNIDEYYWYGWISCKGLKPGKLINNAIIKEVYSIVRIKCNKCGKLNSADVIRCIDCKEDK